MPDESTSMGVSAGDGMIHYVLLTRDDVGRSIVDTRVIDVDRSDGLDVAGRVNAGIDLVLGTARDSNVRVGPIGVAARTAKQRRELQSRGAGPRRQIHLVHDDEAVVAYLSATGQINRFSSVVIVDCGDTGMSLYTVEPSTSRISDPERSRALTGRKLDRAIVTQLVSDDSPQDPIGARVRRGALLSACRTAKEEISAPSTSAGTGSILVADGGGHMTLTGETIDAAAGPMIDEARSVLTRYLGDLADRGVHPEAVVLVGGIANLSAARTMVTRDHGVEVLVPDAPELAASIGAAILARAQTVTEATSRLAFIGGRRNREWLSATPLAVVGAILAAAMMTIYAVSSSLTGQNGPAPSPSSQTTAAPTTTTDTVSSQQQSQAVTTREPEPQIPQTPEQAPVATPQRTEPRWGDAPGWATTELPPTTQPGTPSTTTRTLSPYPLPSLPWPTGTRPTPTIPPEFLPPGLAPQTTAPTPPPPTPGDEVPQQETPSSPTPQGANPQGANDRDVTGPGVTTTPPPPPLGD